MTATQALKVYKRGRRLFVQKLDTECTVEATSLGMHLSRMGQHRKLVLFVKLYRHDNGQRITMAHYDLP